MKTNYELLYSILDNEQIKEFSYGITDEIVSNYLQEHQEEFELWKNTEDLKSIIKQGLKAMVIDFNERKRILEEMRNNKNE